MSTKNDYTADEWKAITAAPFLAGLYISMSDPSGIAGITKEALAVGRAIGEAKASGSVEVVTAIADSIKAGGISGRPELPDLPKGDVKAARAAMAEHLRSATAAIAKKSPAEADAYKAWLLAAAQKVAEAAKEGGFLGFGGTRVSAEEQAALADLGSTLGISAQSV